MRMNLQKAEFVRSAATARRTFPGIALPQVAFAGRSNVGKSSVINRLLQPEEFCPGGRGPRQDHPHQLLSDRRALSTWWICPATATPRCPRRRRTAGAG